MPDKNISTKWQPKRRSEEHESTNLVPHDTSFQVSILQLIDESVYQLHNIVVTQLRCVRHLQQIFDIRTVSWPHTHTVLYSLTETEIETEIYITSLSETKMFCKTEMKYRRKSESIKRNSNWNEIDFTTKMITQNVVKNLASHCFHVVIWWQLTTFDYDTSKSLPGRCHSRSPSTYATMESWKPTLINTYTNLGISVRRRCHHLLKQIAGSPSTDFRTGPRTCSCTCITGLGGTCFLCVWMCYSWTQKQTV